MTDARRGVAAIVLGTGFGQGLLVAVSPILSRLYDAEDFALLQVFTGVVAMAAVFASGRLELAVPLAADETEARAVFRLGMFAVVGVSVLLAVVGWATGGLWAHGSTLEGLRRVWWLVPLTVAVLATFQLVSAVLIRRQRYRELAVRNAVQGVGTASAQVGFGAGGAGSIGLLLGSGIGRLFGVVWVAGPATGGMFRRSRESEPGERIGRERLVAAGRRFAKFPLITTWSALLNNAAQWAPAFVFPLTYGAGPAGLLGFTMRLLTMPITVIGQSVAQVFLSRGAQAQRDGTGELPRLTWLAVRRLAMVAVGPALLLALLAPLVFGWLFGENWERAGDYARILSIAFFIQFVASPIGNVFNVAERQSVALCWDAVRLVLTVTIPTAVWAAGGSDLAGVAAYAGVLVFSYGGVLMLAWWVLKRA